MRFLFTKEPLWEFLCQMPVTCAFNDLDFYICACSTRPNETNFDLKTPKCSFSAVTLKYDCNQATCGICGRTNRSSIKVRRLLFHLFLTLGNSVARAFADERNVVLFPCRERSSGVMSACSFLSSLCQGPTFSPLHCLLGPLLQCTFQSTSLHTHEPSRIDAQKHPCLFASGRRFSNQ